VNLERLRKGVTLAVRVERQGDTCAPLLAVGKALREVEKGKGDWPRTGSHGDYTRARSSRSACSSNVQADTRTTDAEGDPRRHGAELDLIGTDVSRRPG
jgi:hypothetical protein